MKKMLWLFAVLAAVFALFLACKGGGDDDSTVDMTDQWPNFSNAYKLERTQFEKAGEGFITEWGFKGAADDEDFGAPQNTKTFLSSKFIIIATVGGGVIGGPSGSPKTEFNPLGYEPIKFKVDAANLLANGDWDNATYVENTFRLKATNTQDWIVSFPHSEDETVFFVYDLNNFNTKFGGINNTNSQIVFKIAWGPDEKSLGQYQAYITDAALTRGLGIEIKNDSSDTNLADGVSLGWITKNTGLTPAP